MLLTGTDTHTQTRTHTQTLYMLCYLILLTDLLQSAASPAQLHYQFVRCVEEILTEQSKSVLLTSSLCLLV